MSAIDAPMTNAIQNRVSLQNTWSQANVFRYMRPNMTAVDVAIMARNRRYFIPPSDMSTPVPVAFPTFTCRSAAAVGGSAAAHLNSPRF